MADFTSAIRISGVLDGRTINVTHTYLVEDVDDIFHITARASRSLQPSYTGFEYDYPSYLLMINRSKAGEFVVKMEDSVGPTVMGTNLHPGEFCVLAPDTALGPFNVSSTATTTTYLDCDSILVRSNQTYIRATEGAVLMAFKPVT